MKLTTKFSLIVVATATVAILVLGYFVSTTIQSSLKTQIGERQLELAETTMNQIDRVLYERYLDIQSLAENELLEEFIATNDASGEEEMKTRRFLKKQSFLSGPWDAFFVVDKEGAMILSSNTKEEGGLISTEPNSLIAYEAAMRGEVYYSDVVISDDTGRPTVIFAAPIQDEELANRPIVGVVIGNYAWAAIVEIVKQLDAEAHLVNSRGELIADSGVVHGGEIFEDLSDKELFKHAFEEKEGAYGVHMSTHGDFKALASHSHQQGYLGYEGSNWIMVVEQEADIAFASARDVAIRTILILIPIIGLAASAVLLLIVRFLSGPVESLITATKKMASGDLSRRVEVKSKDEIGQLGQSFNQMAEKLQESYETLEKKVEERTKKTAELNNILKILNKIMRHDILNDLTVMQGSVDMYLEYKEKSGMNINNILGIVNSSVLRSKNIIDRMRDLEIAVSEGKELVKINVANVIREAATEFPNINIEIKGEAVIMADQALSSIATNLFRNSKVHGKASEVNVTISDLDKEIQIRVADNGKGIAAEIKSQLFAEGASFGETGNTGLGLFIIRKTIERYGGSVSMEDNESQGAVFVLKIPKAV